MMKATFEKEESKVLIYRDYKSFNFNSFKSELLSKFHHNNATFTSFEKNLVNVLNQQAPKKSNIFRDNQKPHLNKSLRAAIMRRSRLKNEANKSQLPVIYPNITTQRNLVVKLNKKNKKEYFENLNVPTTSKPFWDKHKSYFSNKHTKGDSNIVLIKKEDILLMNKKIADVLTSYFDTYIKVKIPFNSLITGFIGGSDTEEPLLCTFLHIKTQEENPHMPVIAFTLDQIMHLHINFHKLPLT